MKIKTLGEMEMDDPAIFATVVSDMEFARQEMINKKKRDYEAKNTPTYTDEEIAEHEAEQESEE